MSPTRRLSVFLAAFTVFVMFMYAAACSTTDAPTVPQDPTVWVTPNAQQTAEVLVSVSDVRSRVVPSLSDRASPAKLDAALEAIAAAFTAAKPGDAAQQIAAARAILAAYAPAAQVDDAVELSVIALVLDRASQLIGMPALTNAAR